MAQRLASPFRLAFLSALLAINVDGCSCDKKEEEEEEPATCTASSECQDGRVCEAVRATTTGTCADPLVVRGKVVEEDGTTGIVDAEVLVVDESGTPASEVVKSGVGGAYEVAVPVARNEDGTLASTRVTMRASAQGYETFPSAVRRALPLSLNQATLQDGRYAYEGELTTLLLVAVADPTTLGQVKGRVTGTTSPAGVLVTAATGTTPTALTALTAADGAFVIHNVPAATYTVSGYGAGLQLTPATGVVVVAAQTVEDVTLAASTTETGTVTGSVSIVAGGCTGGTSVVLVPRETLLPTTVFPLNALSTIRAEVPRGLRAPSSGTAPNITGAYTISGVPDGTYAVLAAYENEADPCVFDPSSIAGAFLVPEITVPATSGGRAIDVPGFKVTGAVAVVGPGAGDDPEEVTSLTPTFSWQAYSSSKNYQVAVYDAYGTRLWVTTACADDGNGCNTLSVTYGTAGGGTTQPAQAPVLEAGHLYQWRVIALGSRNGRTCGFTGVEVGPDSECISTSEDLKGLFLTPSGT